MTCGMRIEQVITIFKLEDCDQVWKFQIFMKIVQNYSSDINTQLSEAINQFQRSILIVYDFEFGFIFFR